MRLRRGPPGLGTVLGATVMTTVGALPVFLLGSQSVLIREELHFDEQEFGIAVGAFFGAAALSALITGDLADRLGQRRCTIGAGLLASVGGAGLALVAHSWPMLVALMVVLGIANAACHATSNLALATAVPAHRRGLGFGVKQSAVPLAIVIAGLAVPTVGVAMGWRWSFALTGLVGLALAVGGLQLPRQGTRRYHSAESDRPPVDALIVTAIAIALASAAANSLGSFAPSWAYHVGLTPVWAGLLMSLGSGMSIVVRIVGGHLADRRQGRILPIVTLQMLIGALAFAALSFPSPASVVPATLVAFAVGWSWPGLVLYAVVRIGRDAPATASGFVQAGAFFGGAAGPVAFGMAVSLAGYEAAWLGAATLILMAALLVSVARRIFIADLAARPPRQAIEYGGQALRAQARERRC